MPPARGDKLGPYEMLEPIGKGGMGEVWKAHDPRVGRDVAIKISAAQFSERFEREARAIAQLNHPNICTLYDVGPNYLVMEYIEGPTLAERVKQGALPLDETLDIARQIAAALEEAHEKGVVHRDLKPGNVKIRPGGIVKVLDFGLAKVAPASAGGSAQSENSPTLTMGLTEAGMILGTASYMAPEQAKGRPVDKRADIWAFGVVLYEMLTGDRLFKAGDVADTLAAVLRQEIDYEVVPAQTRPLLRRCLEREPSKRLRDIADAMPMAEAWSGLQLATGTSIPAPRPANLSWALAAVAAAMTLLAAGAGFAWWRASRPVEQPLVRLDVDLGPEISLAPNRLNSVVISPDGTRLVYAATVSGGPLKLFTRRLDQPKATELRGTDGASGPFFSPDGQWVGFVAPSGLNKISVEGGAVVPLSNSRRSVGASWGEDGIIAGNQLDGIVRIPSDGGMPTPLLELARGERAQLMPQILPGGKAMLFVAYTGAPSADSANIEVASLGDRGAKAFGRRVVVRGGASPHYVATSNGAGHLLYNNKSTLFAIPFDLGRLETRGTAVPILEDIAYEGPTGTAQFNVSRAGTLVYRRGSASAASGMRIVQWLDAAGKLEPLLAKPGVYSSPRLSPDGKRVALMVTEGGNQDVWIYEPQRDAITKLTFGGGNHPDPIWSPDGRYIFFGSETGGMFWTRSDGAGQPQPLTQSKNPQRPWSVSPDAKWLGYIELAHGQQQIWIVPIENQGGQWQAGKAERFLNTEVEEINPVFSPDGRWVAYHSAEAGGVEVFVRPFPAPASGQGGKWQISKGNLGPPVWSRNGHELFYPAPDGAIMAVSYTVKGDVFVADKPRVWLAKAPPAGNLEVSPDGKRLVVVTPAETEEAPKAEHEVVFLENFFDELRRRVPLGK